MIVEIKLGGKYRTLRFNNYQKEALGKLYDNDPIESSRLLGEKWATSALRAAGDLIYTGLIGDYEAKLKDRDFTREDVAEWVGDASDEDLAKVINTWSETDTVRTIIQSKNGSDTKKKQAGKTLKTSQSEK
jgi:hypothetical protein